MSTFNHLIPLTDGVRQEIIARNFLDANVTIQNLGEGNVYLGNYEVTSENFGLRLIPNMGICIDLAVTDELYAITSGDDSTISVLIVRGK